LEVWRQEAEKNRTFLVPPVLYEVKDKVICREGVGSGGWEL
jgi:hypothetical protein